MKIAIVGRIGSGKSTILEAFKKAGWKTLQLDELTSKLYQNPHVLKKIKEAFGEDVVKNNKPDRKQLAKLVFKSEKRLRALNEIFLPFFEKEIKKLKGNWAIEGAVIPGSQLEKLFDLIIWVERNPVQCLIAAGKKFGYFQALRRYLVQKTKRYDIKFLNRGKKETVLKKAYCLALSLLTASEARKALLPCGEDAPSKAQGASRKR